MGQVKTLQVQEPIYCRCGCGTELKYNPKYNSNGIWEYPYRLPRYVKGHHGKHIVSEEGKKKLSIGRIGKFNSEETRRNISIRNTGQLRNEETKRKLRNAFSLERRDAIRTRLKETRKWLVIPMKDSSIEVKIQDFLSQLQIPYLKHQWIDIEHGYQCDILIPSLNLVIECDGDYWHHYPYGNDIDHIRTKELIRDGYKILRLWECEIRAMKLEGFKNLIKWQMEL